MTTSPLKVEQGRAKFEAWFKDRYRGILDETNFKLVWVTALDSWLASRAAIVVELPDYTGDIDDELSCFDGEYEWGNRAGASYAVTQCAGIIRAAGITVKGDS